ncbi:L,D-transpeptidase [Streptomyces sp. NPDC020801]|uniref:L,D-transpeptidase n=1 Tax=unclassified Streptomyces TaxID=2593676 RepID=UPI0037AB85D9
MVLAVGVLTNLGHEPGHRSTPAASRRHGPVTTATVAPFAAEATVDLTTRTLRVAGRVLPVSSGVPEWPTPMGRMTVVAKYEVTELPTDALHPDGKSEIKLPWVIELRTPGQGRNYIVPVTWAPKAPGNYSATGGWIGVRTSDAHWLYTQLHEGSVLVVMGEPPATQAPEIAPTA